MTPESRARKSRPRPRRPRTWRVTTRLRVIVIAPLVAVLGFAGLALSTDSAQARRVSALGKLALVSADAGDLAYHLQRERARAGDLLGFSQSDGSAVAQRLDAFLSQSAETDRHVTEYHRQRRALSSVPAGSAAILNRIDSELGQLGTLRQQTRSAAQGSISAVAFGYRIVIADLLAYRQSMAQAAGFANLADGFRAAAAISMRSRPPGSSRSQSCGPSAPGSSRQ